MKKTDEQKEQHKRDREIVWDAIKNSNIITTKRATSASGFKSAHYVSHRMKELEEEGRLILIKGTHRRKLWEVNKGR